MLIPQYPEPVLHVTTVLLMRQVGLLSHINVLDIRKRKIRHIYSQLQFVNFVSTYACFKDKNQSYAVESKV